MMISRNEKRYSWFLGFVSLLLLTWTIFNAVPRKPDIPETQEQPNAVPRKPDIPETQEQPNPALSNNKYDPAAVEDLSTLPGELPKYMVGFAQLPHRFRHLRTLRWSILWNSNSREEVRETDDKSTLNNGFAYTIDAFGRVIRVEGEFPSSSMAAAQAVVARPAARLRDARRQYCQLLGWFGTNDFLNYDAGHLIMHRFKTCDHPLNLVPMHPKVNRGDYKQVENRINVLRKTGPVKLSLSIFYASAELKEVQQGVRSLYYPLCFEFRFSHRDDDAGAKAWGAEELRLVNNPVLEADLKKTTPRKENPRKPKRNQL